MQSFEIKQKLASIPSPVLSAHILCFDNWVDPEGFYDMTTSERRALLNRYRAVSVDPTEHNQWIWFGAYDTKKYPKYSTISIPAYLYQIVIQPHNNARIRGVLNTTKSDVNPFKYFKAMVLTKTEILKLRADMMELPLEKVLTEKQNEQFENKVQAALAECKEYYMVGSPTQERDFMKATLIQAGHMPIAVDEAMSRSGLEFKD